MYSIIMLVCLSVSDCTIVVPPPPVQFFTTAAECVEAIKITVGNIEARGEEVYLAVPTCTNWRQSFQNLEDIMGV